MKKILSTLGPLVLAVFFLSTGCAKLKPTTDLRFQPDFATKVNGDYVVSVMMFGNLNQPAHVFKTVGHTSKDRAGNLIAAEYRIFRKDGTEVPVYFHQIGQEGNVLNIETLQLRFSLSSYEQRENEPICSWVKSGEVVPCEYQGTPPQKW